MYTLSTHVKSHLSGERPVLSSPDLLEQLIALVEPRLRQFNTRWIHQVAIVLGEYKTPVQLGYSTGRRIIVTVDIRTKIVTTIFAREPRQGRPMACQVMIDLDGNEVG
jgi:hypothetical protein